jgi:hypothetical protein
VTSVFLPIGRVPVSTASSFAPVAITYSRKLATAFLSALCPTQRRYLLTALFGSCGTQKSDYMPPLLIFPVSGKRSPLICPVSGLMIRETRGCVVDPIALLFVVGVGFALGYGVREWKSRKRRRRYTYLRETADEAPRVTS